MAFYVAVPLALAAALLQAVPQAGPLAGLKPDLVLVLAAMAGMLLGLRRGLTIAFLGGIVLDLFSGMPFGFVTLLLLLVTSLARFPSPGRLEVNPLVCMLVVALVALLFYTVYSLGVMALGGETDWLRLATTAIFPSVLTSAFLSLPVYGLFSLLSRKTIPLKEDWR